MKEHTQVIVKGWDSRFAQRAATGPSNPLRQASRELQIRGMLNAYRLGWVSYRQLKAKIESLTPSDTTTQQVTKETK